MLSNELGACSGLVAVAFILFFLAPPRRIAEAS